MRLIDSDLLLEAVRLVINDRWNYENIIDGDEVAELITNALTVQREGWVSVPIEPTDEMLEAGRTQGRNNELEFRHRDEGATLIYKAMLSAAPKE